MIKRIIILPIIVCLSFISLHSFDITEYTKAREYLEQWGEVCFSFPINSKSDLTGLTNIVSIDKVLGTKVYAYANKEEFREFLEYGLYYEVLTPPGELLKNPKMYHGNPGESFEWDRYPTFDAYIEMMHKFEADYPELCNIDTIGESVEGRVLLVAKVTDNVNENEKEPKFINGSSIHGNETTGYIVTLRMIDYLLSNYGQDSRVTRIVDSIETWINPLMNPDGTYRGGNSSVSSATRYNSNGIDLNRDYPSPEGGTDHNKSRIEVETEQYIAFESEQGFVMGADMHGGIECALTPWGYTRTKPWDNDWFLMIARQYRDLAQEYGQSGYFTSCVDGVGNGASDLYEASGILVDWQLYFNHCRGFTIEMSSDKLLPEDELNNLWDYNKESLLTFYEQVLNGIRGTVTDSLTNEPLAAKVFVEDHDRDSSHVYSTLPHGDYYRPIYRGTYEVTFSCDGYLSKTYKNITVENDEATILDAMLWDGSTGTGIPYMTQKPAVSIIPFGKDIQIKCNNAGSINTVALYDLNGKLIRSVTPQLSSHQKTIEFNGMTHVGNGCYIVEVQTKKQLYSQRIMFYR